MTMQLEFCRLISHLSAAAGRLVLTNCACVALRIYTVDVCAVAKSVLEPEAALRLMRYVNAAHALA